MGSRRQFLQAFGTLLAHSAVASTLPPRSPAARNDDVDYGHHTLGAGIRSRHVDNNNGVTMHLLEAGFQGPGRPCVVLLHGFPELAYTWRNQLLPLAAAGYHVVAPDLRGCGRSAVTPVQFDDDLLPYAWLNRVSDVLGLVRAMGVDRVAAVVGHDWGAPTAAWCALLRPDIFRSVVLMSTPFDGPGTLPFDTANTPRRADTDVDIQQALAALPHPRRHYWWYSASRTANDDMWHARQGVHDLLRALFYYKSADWPGNRPFRLKAWTATELAKLPTYYVMNKDQGIAETMAAHMPTPAEIEACRWLTEDDLQVYSTEYSRTGFQGGLNDYRILIEPRYDAELNAFSGRTIDVPAVFIGGAHDWGVYQSPGALEGMQSGPFKHLLGVHLVEGAGHSLAEEQPQRVNDILVRFLSQNVR
jgi:pimeloyl-ACP methyl ester carboxylesterase